jgi:D-alanyl-lipoteichoic acid acyltransferase DltB (MBOAT superfamily)
MVIADNLSVFVDQVYEAPSGYSGLEILLGMGFYSFQIYADFFGYSIIAIGSARLLGVKLMDNFKTPYLSLGIGEFWQRWHISLSTWFRDYLYFPMGGNRVAIWRWLYNIFTVFLLSGIWHGANWTFVFWGGLYALVYVIENRLDSVCDTSAKPSFLKRLILTAKTFILVTLIWVFFRSPSITVAFEMFGAVWSNLSLPSSSLQVPAVIWLTLGAFILSDFLLYNKRFDTVISALSMPVRWSVYAFLLFAVCSFSGVTDHPFIYFQF